MHIPFCRRKCPYCSFFSETSLDRIPIFLKSLYREIELSRSFFSAFDTIYIGGGTPSVLAAGHLENILNHVLRSFCISSGAEITLEINPADACLDYLKSLAKLGFNRLNIGVQSFDDHALSFLGRRHDRKQALHSINAAFEAGFDNVGIDLIYGIPGQDMPLWLDGLRQAVSLHPCHLSCYQLTIESDTPLGRRYKEKAFAMPSEDEHYNFFMATSEFLESHGYIHYEVSNFAKGMALSSLHNQKYWAHTPYLGLGPSAHSFDGGKRWWNYRSISEYIKALGKGSLPIEDSETLTEEQWKLETVFLGLRTARGIHLPGFSRRYRCELLSGGNISKTNKKAAKFLEIKDDYLCPTRAGLAVADGLASILCFNTFSLKLI